MEKRQEKLGKKLSSLINSLPGFVFYSNNPCQSRMTYISAGCLTLTGYPPQSFIASDGIAYRDIIDREDLPIVLERISTAIADRQSYEIEYRIRTKTGETRWFWETGKGEFDRCGQLQELEGFITDITKRKQVEEALTQAEEKYRSTFNNITQGIFQACRDGRYLKINPALAKLYGYDLAEGASANLIDIPYQPYVDPKRRLEFLHLLETQGEIANFESLVYRKDGSTIWISETASAVRDRCGRFLYYEGTVEDITYRRLAEEKLVYHAFYDSLTGLPNRDWFVGQLQTAIALSRQDPDYLYAVLFIDLDRFKIVNDSLGHLAGDLLLQKVAERLQSSLRSSDKMARFGGDEFAILLEEIDRLEEVIKVVERIRAKLSLPFNLEKEKVFTSASIGITLSTIGYERPEDLLRDADVAMYQAKEKQKGSYTLFNPGMQAAAVARLQLENSLRRAIAQQQFSLHYQPIICFQTGHLAGFEALIRWHHPTLGWISPAIFIPIAEQTGLINEIGWWVCEEACRQLREWKDSFWQASELVMNVNLSAYQLRQVGLVERFDLLLRSYQLDGKDLKLEITESCFLETVASETTIVQQLKTLGIGLCIDDFGTGYSSLSRLHDFPIDTLKIDRSFIHQLEFERTAIVQTIVTLAHTLGMKVVAEGIETPTQLEKLQSLGSDLGQGFLFSKPVDREIASQLVRSQGLACDRLTSIQSVKTQTTK